MGPARRRVQIAAGLRGILDSGASAAVPGSVPHYPHHAAVPIVEDGRVGHCLLADTDGGPGLDRARHLGTRAIAG